MDAHVHTHARTDILVRIGLFSRHKAVSILHGRRHTRKRTGTGPRCRGLIRIRHISAQTMRKMCKKTLLNGGFGVSIRGGAGRQLCGMPRPHRQTYTKQIPEQSLTYAPGELNQTLLRVFEEDFLLF